MNAPRLTVSPAPHWHTGVTLTATTVAFLIALLLPALNGVFIFGLSALRVILAAVITAVVVESLMRLVLGRPIKRFDVTNAVLLGLIFALFLPASVPLWMVVLGVTIAAVVGRQLYGGVGGHPFHPVMVGLVVLLLSYPSVLNKFPAPQPWKWFEPGLDVFALGSIKEMGWMDFQGYMEMYEKPVPMFLWGNVAGPIGQVGLLAIVLGGVFLIFTRHINFLIPLSIIATVAILGAVFHASNPEVYPIWYWHLVSGSVLFIAFFVATDSTTSPNNPVAVLLFGMGFGLLTILIRVYGTYTDGGPFALLLMNLLMPLLDRIKPRPYGKKVKVYA